MPKILKNYFDKHPYALKLYLIFTSAFGISAFTFGGGYVMVPLLKSKFVDDLGYIEEDEVMNILAIGQSAPGAIAINTSLLIGQKAAGLPGAALALLGTVLPPLLILTVISGFYQEFSTNRFVQAFLGGMKAAVVAVICNTVFEMAAGIIKAKDRFAAFLMIATFIALIVFDLHPAIMVLSGAVLGILYKSFFKESAEKAQNSAAEIAQTAAENSEKNTEKEAE